MTPEEIFLSHLRQIEKVIEHACRRHHFRREEAQDFASTVKLKLIEDDYGVIRKFKGKSSLTTFLNIVVQRLMLDYMNHLWGKWRASAEAERLGPEAVLLETLMVRDGLSFDEACETLWTRHQVKMSWQQLAELAGRLPPRSPRRMEGEEALEHLPAPGDQADEHVKAKEREATRKKVQTILQRELKKFSAEDRLIIKMRGEFKVVEIARRLGLDQKRLYRRIEGLLETLREALQREGISARDIADILDFPEH